MKLSFALALLAGTAAWAADTVPLDVKTGEWEYTVTTQMGGMSMPQGAAAGMPTIPPEQLAKMPPEQRAKVEAAMKQAGAMMSGKPTTTTSQSCIKKDDLAKMMPNSGRDQSSCKTTLVSSSRNKQELKMDCDSNGGKQTGTVIVEAVSPESTKFSLQITAVQNGQPMNMTVNGTSKWLSSTCTESK